MVDQSLVASREEQLADLRFVRNIALRETDYMVLGDNPDPEIVAYRQALRDITNNFVSLDDLVYPPIPEALKNGK